MIDLTGETGIGLPAGVTLAGSATLLTTQMSTSPLLRTLGPDVMLDGVRLEGPDGTVGTGPYDDPNSRGLDVHHAGCVIRNVEVLAWSHAGIYCYGGAGEVVVEDSSIHHCQRTGLGYGISTDGAVIRVRRTTFDFCRHAIASTGDVGSAYEADQCAFGANFTNTTLDMHESRTTPGLGGAWIDVHDCTFAKPNGTVIFVLSPSTDMSHVTNNRFAKSSGVVRQRRSGVDYWAPPEPGDFVNLTVSGNQYGASVP